TRAAARARSHSPSASDTPAQPTGADHAASEPPATKRPDVVIRHRGSTQRLLQRIRPILPGRLDRALDLLLSASRRPQIHPRIEVLPAANPQRNPERLDLPELLTIRRRREVEAELLLIADRLHHRRVRDRLRAIPTSQQVRRNELLYLLTRNPQQARNLVEQGRPLRRLCASRLCSCRRRCSRTRIHPAVIPRRRPARSRRRPRRRWPVVNHLPWAPVRFPRLLQDVRVLRPRRRWPVVNHLPWAPVRFPRLLQDVPVLRPRRRWPVVNHLPRAPVRFPRLLQDVPV